MLIERGGGSRSRLLSGREEDGDVSEDTKVVVSEVLRQVSNLEY